MKFLKKHTDSLSEILDKDDVKNVKSVVTDDSVMGWSVFDKSGNVVTGEGISDVATGVCANILDMAIEIGRELGEESPRPTITFSKGSDEMYTTPFADANVLIMRDKQGGYRTEFKNGR